MTTRAQQIEYITDYSQYIRNKSVQIQILNAAMRYIEDYCNGDKSNHIHESRGSPIGLNFFLNNFDDLTIQQIYDIVYNRMQLLNSPRIEKQTPSMNFNFGDN
jgi:hypothetical protein